jgi:hypothetical protein
MYRVNFERRCLIKFYMKLIDLPALCCVSFQGFFLLASDYCAGIKTIGVTTLSISFPASYHMTSQSSSLLHLESGVGISTIGITMLSVCFPELYHMASQGSSSLDSESCVGIRTIDVETSGVNLPAPCCMHCDACLRFIQNLVSASG